MRHIGEWLEEQPKPFFIIGTHCDLDGEYAASLSAKRLGDYTDRFRKLSIVNDLFAHGGGDKRTRLVLGSMKSIQDTEELVYSLFTHVVP
jgi:hypothetical protein